MTTREIGEINAERLGEWGAFLIERHSTPFLIVAAGHDDRKGEVTVCVPEGFTPETILTLLEGAARRVKRGDYTEL